MPTAKRNTQESATQGLRWPSGWARTPAHRRASGDRFNRQHPGTGERGPISVDEASRDLHHELYKLGAKRVQVTFDHTGADPGVAVYFLLDYKPMAMPRDEFETAAANLRSLALAVEAMRTLERHGGRAMQDRAMAGFASLPPPRSHWEILGVRPDASSDEIERAFRVKAKECHPDRGGSNAAMSELNAARDEALRQATSAAK